MTLNSINITELVEQVKAQLKDDKNISPSLRMAVEMILLVIVMLSEKIGLNSKNSSKPPSSDPNREKNNRSNSNNSRGGQKRTAR